MSDFRSRFGTELGAAARRLARGGPAVDFRARLGVQLAEASVELRRGRAGAIAPAGVSVLPRAGAASDFRARLGAQLAASAATLAVGSAPAAARAPRRRRWPLPRLARPLAVALAAIGFAGAATASSMWLVSVGNPNGGVDPGLSATAPPRPQLAALAVLRRPQTAADRGPGVGIALEDINDFSTGVRSNFVRVLETTAAGPVVLVPVAHREPSPAGTSASATGRAISDALCVYYPVAGASALGSHPACWSTVQLLDGQAVATAAGRVFGLVPDGVTAVRITEAGSQANSVAVAGNFFDAPLPAPGATVGGAPTPSMQLTVTLVRG